MITSQFLYDNLMSDRGCDSFNVYSVVPEYFSSANRHTFPNGLISQNSLRSPSIISRQYDVLRTIDVYQKTHK